LHKERSKAGVQLEQAKIITALSPMNRFKRLFRYVEARRETPPRASAADVHVGDWGKALPPALSDALIVMSTHSAPAIRRWALGSVTEKTLRYAANPVLTIRG
jgi:nucleotide-binding universal stress UspA family protein